MMLTHVSNLLYRHKKYATSEKILSQCMSSYKNNDIENVLQRVLIVGVGCNNNTIVINVIIISIKFIKQKFMYFQFDTFIIGNFTT